METKKLQKKYEDDDNELDFSIYLNRREIDLIRRNQTMESQVTSGKVTPQQYLSAVKSMMQLNLRVYKQAKAASLNARHMKIILARIKMLKEEYDLIDN